MFRLIGSSVAAVLTVAMAGGATAQDRVTFAGYGGEPQKVQTKAFFEPATKAILLNSPMNPCGKVFTAEELGFIAELTLRHDVYAICDEVYEHLTFDGARHIPLMTLPGMRERTMRIGSAGKTFSLTGWKVGYVTAPAALAMNVAKAHQNLTFTTAPNLQRAVAVGLGKDDAYFASLSGALQAKRDRLAAGLASLGLGVLPAILLFFAYNQVRFGSPWESVTRPEIATPRSKRISIGWSLAVTSSRPYPVLLTAIVWRPGDALKTKRPSPSVRTGAIAAEPASPTRAFAIASPVSSETTRPLRVIGGTAGGAGSTRGGWARAVSAIAPRSTVASATRFIGPTGLQTNRVIGWSGLPDDPIIQSPDTAVRIR
jgi:hypothetical protein